MDYMTEIIKHREELEKIPENKRYILAGRGVELINKIFRLEIALERKVKKTMEEAI